MSLIRNRHAHEAIRRWLPRVPQHQLFYVRDLYQMAQSAGVECGFATLIAALRQGVEDGLVSTPSRGVYEIHLDGQPTLNLGTSPAPAPTGTITLYDLYTRLGDLQSAVARIEVALNARTK
jgi:hypothetical protein